MTIFVGSGLVRLGAERVQFAAGSGLTWSIGCLLYFGLAQPQTNRAAHLEQAVAFGPGSFRGGLGNPAGRCHRRPSDCPRLMLCCFGVGPKQLVHRPQMPEDRVFRHRTLGPGLPWSLRLAHLARQWILADSSANLCPRRDQVGQMRYQNNWFGLRCRLRLQS